MAQSQIAHICPGGISSMFFFWVPMLINWCPEEEYGEEGEGERQPV